MLYFGVADSVNADLDALLAAGHQRFYELTRQPATDTGEPG
jgi:hypothetical protein